METLRLRMGEQIYAHMTADRTLATLLGDAYARRLEKTAGTDQPTALIADALLELAESTPNVDRAMTLLAEASAVLFRERGEEDAQSRDALLAHLNALVGGKPFAARAVATAAERDEHLCAALNRAGARLPTNPMSITAWLGSVSSPRWRAVAKRIAGKGYLWKLEPRA